MNLNRPNRPLTIALCISLIAHGLTMRILNDQEIRRLQAVLLAGLYQHVPSASGRAGFAVNTRPKAPILPPVKEEAELPEPTPEVNLPVKQPNYSDLFGEKDGKGTAMNFSDGDKDMLALLGSEIQAALTRQPGPPIVPGSTAASANAAPTTPIEGSATASIAESLAPFGMLLPASKPQPRFTKPDPAITPSTISKSEIQKQYPQEDERKRNDTAAKATDNLTELILPATQPAISNPKPSMPSGQQVATVSPTAVTPPQQAVRPKSATSGGGEIGVKSPSESDPFSTSESFSFRNGKVSARNGRKVKTTKPRITDAGVQALLSMNDPSVLVGIKVNEKGTVDAVTILRSSGSNAVDLPVYRAAFEWEIEPTLDANGRPIPNAFVINFVFH